MGTAIVFLMAIAGLCFAGPTPDYCNVESCKYAGRSGKTTLCGVVKKIFLFQLTVLV